MTDFLIFIPLGYLLGSLPFGLIAGRVAMGVDIREHGSGNSGMTNVLRTVGARAAALVLLLDMGKAVLAVALARVFSDSAGVEVTAALAAIAGHNWPLFTGFKGGRGTSTGWGALIILSPVSGLIATFIGVVTIAIWRYVSLGSLLGAVSGATAVIALSLIQFEPLAYAWYGAFGALMIIVRHRDNIGRLIRGQESKLGQPADQNGAERKTGRGRRQRWPRSA